MRGHELGVVQLLSEHALTGAQDEGEGLRQQFVAQTVARKQGAQFRQARRRRRLAEARDARLARTHRADEPPRPRAARIGEPLHAGGDLRAQAHRPVVGLARPLRIAAQQNAGNR